jgi:hypothetical protein
VLLGRAHQRERAHARDHVGELPARALQHLHVDLVLEVRGRRPDLARQPDDAPCFGEVACQWLLDDEALEASAVSRRGGDCLHDLDPREVRAEESDDVDVAREVLDAVVDLHVAQTGAPRRGRECFRS